MTESRVRPPHALRGGPQDHGTAGNMRGHDRSQPRRRTVRYLPELAFDPQDLEDDALETEMTDMADQILEDADYGDLTGDGYTSSSNGITPEDEEYFFAQRVASQFDVLAAAYGQPWMEAGLRDLGIDMTPSLRRPTMIDPDPTEAPDEIHDFVGFYVTTRP